jgi:hypothetical protein
MRDFLENEPGCSAMTSHEMLLSYDVALVIILKMCTRLTMLNLDVGHFHETQTNTFTRSNLELHYRLVGLNIATGLQNSILPLLHTLTLVDNIGNDYNPMFCVSCCTQFLLCPRLTTFSGRQISSWTHGSNSEIEPLVKRRGPSNIKEC